MAFVEDIPVVTIYATDSGGVTSWCEMAVLPQSATVAQLLSFAQTLAAAVAAASDARIERFKISRRARDTAAAAAGAGSWNGNAGLFIFTSIPSTRFMIDIGCLTDSVLSATPPDIDTTNPAVQALVDLVVTGDGTIQPSDLEHNDITALDTAYQMDKLISQKRRIG